MCLSDGARSDDDQSIKIGVPVGVTLAVLIIIAIIVIVFLLYRKRFAEFNC